MTLFNSKWVKSPKQQDILADRISNHIQTLKRRNLKVSIASPYAPNRGEWERAYVRQSGFRLPIEPGTKLIWVSTLTGQTQIYTTVYDLLNGLQSSGAIFPYLEDETYPPIRHIATNVNGVVSNIYNKSLLSGQTSFGLDPYQKMFDGLEAMLYILKVNKGTTDPTVPNGWSVSISNYIDPLRDITLTTTADHWLAVHNRFAVGGFGASLGQGASVGYNVGGPDNTAFNMIGTYFANYNPASMIVIYINGLSHLLSPTTGVIDNLRGGAGGWSISTSRVSIAAEAQVNFTTFQAVNKCAGQFGFSPSSATTDVVPNSINGNIYGIYNKQTAMELEEGYQWLLQN